jgi:hypothetical protein
MRGVAIFAKACFGPRVYCYLDDIIGDDWGIHCEYVGELLAIKEFKLHGMNKCLLCMPLITPCIANTCGLCISYR